MNSKNTTVIICCAGMGTRLGIGTTKALININNKPLIIRMLEQLDSFDDIRIVVGYQAEKVIKTVNDYRKDILFAFNNEYEKNGPAASMWKGLLNARSNIIVLDGDLVFEPKSFSDFLCFDKECIAYSDNLSDEPIYVNINNDEVLHFSTKKTSYVWPGIIKIQKNKINSGNNYIFETIENNLPMKAIKLNVMEIDTQDDYERTIKWINNNYIGGDNNE